MDKQSGTNRWWENYLVRYFMPSIAGMVIVRWLCSVPSSGLSSLLYLPNGEPLSTAWVALLFLYGNLFCYVASYPALVFHVTRARDFPGGSWAPSPIDGYIATFVLLIFSVLLHCVPPQYHYWTAVVLVILFAILQFIRLSNVISNNRAFRYADTLARRRANQFVEGGSEFIETYRHMREHGNSALIFVLELALANLIASALAGTAQLPTKQLGAVGVLVAIWASPSVAVHLLGQHLERQFSRFDE